MTMTNLVWQNRKNLPTAAFTCGFCGKDVASEKGYYTGTGNVAGDAFIYLCPRCNRPTLKYMAEQVPGELPGKQIDHLPEEILKLYQEAQRCISANSYTACVLVCRKILMHIGHDKGADEGGSFVSYINHLFDKHYITPDGKGWVDYIRIKGNEANHEIIVSEKEDALALLSLTETLLLNIYDMPYRVPQPKSSTT